MPIQGRESYSNLSKIFVPTICDISKDLPMNNEPIVNEFQKSMEESVYVKKYTNEAAQKMRSLMFGYELGTQIQVFRSEKFLPYIKEHPNEISFSQEFFNKIGLDIHEIHHNMRVEKIPSKFYESKEIVINKGDVMYPEQSFKDYLKTEDARKTAKNYDVELTEEGNWQWNIND